MTRRLFASDSSVPVDRSAARSRSSCPCGHCPACVGALHEQIATLTKERDEARAEVERLRTLIDTPETQDFVRAVQSEVAHQRKRWGSDHDAGKTDADWFWLIGYLAGKALHNPGGDEEKQRHRIVTVAAAAANWFAAKLGKTDMRPGIEPPVCDPNEPPSCGICGSHACMHPGCEDLSRGLEREEHEDPDPADDYEPNSGGDHG